MNKVKIIVDSTVDLTEELYEQFDIDVVPLNVNFGEENYKDGVDINFEQLFKKVEEKGVLPKTAAPSPQDFEAMFRKYIDKGLDIVYMGIGSKFSTSLQNANIAKQEFEDERVYLVDSLNLSTGTGLLALKAARLAKEGKTGKEIKEEIESLVPKVSCRFAVETLEYLHKGGRCSGASALFGHLFHVHPIITVVNGEMLVTKKPRGLMKVALDEMLSELKQDYPNIYLDDVMVTYSGSNKEANEYLLNEVKKVVDPKYVRNTVAGCVINSHCGPGAIGILYIKK